MQVRSISVSFHGKVPHPNIDFASLSSLVSITAELAEGDDVAVCTKELQVRTESLVGQHLDSIVDKMRQRAASARPQAATENTAAQLAAKHGGR